MVKNQRLSQHKLPKHIICVIAQAVHLGPMPGVIYFKLLIIFEQMIHFNFSLGPMNYVAGSDLLFGGQI